MPGLWSRGRSADASPADYSRVVVPLEEAHLHSHSYRLRKQPDSDGENENLEDVDDDADKDDEGQDTDMLVMGSTAAAAEYSIEGLRAEVRRGRTGERWTAYESELFHLQGLLWWMKAEIL